MGGQGTENTNVVHISFIYVHAALSLGHQTIRPIVGAFSEFMFLCDYAGHMFMKRPYHSVMQDKKVKDDRNIVMIFIACNI